MWSRLGQAEDPPFWGRRRRDRWAVAVAVVFVLQPLPGETSCDVFECFPATISSFLKCAARSSLLAARLDSFRSLLKYVVGRNSCMPDVIKMLVPIDAQQDVVLRCPWLLSSRGQVCLTRSNNKKHAVFGTSDRDGT